MGSMEKVWVQRRLFTVVRTLSRPRPPLTCHQLVERNVHYESGVTVACRESAL